MIASIIQCRWGEFNPEIEESEDEDRRRGKAEFAFSARDSPFACRSKLSINVS